MTLIFGWHWVPVNKRYRQMAAAWTPVVLLLGTLCLFACRGGDFSAPTARKGKAVDARSTPSPARRLAPSRPRREPPRPPDAGAPRAASRPATPRPASTLEAPERERVYPTHGPKTRPKVLFRVREELYWPHIPVVHGKTVLHGARGMTLVGLDSESGKPKWRWKGVDTHSKNCFRVFSAIHEGRGILLTETATLLSFDLISGLRHWEHVLPQGTVQVSPALSCRTTVTSDLAFVATHLERIEHGLSRYTGYLRAIELLSGTSKWTRPLNEELQDLVAADHLYLFGHRDEQSSLVALHRVTGSPIWRRSLGRLDLMGETIGFVRDGYVGVCGRDEKARVFDTVTGAPAPEVTRYCGSSVDGLIVRYEEWRARFTVRDARSGTIRWKRNSTYLGNSGFSVADGVVHLGLADDVLALELRTGRKLWSFRLPREPRQERTWLNSPPVPADGVLHFTTSDDHIWALR